MGEKERERDESELAPNYEAVRKPDDETLKVGRNKSHLTGVTTSPLPCVLFCATPLHIQQSIASPPIRVPRAGLRRRGNGSVYMHMCVCIFT